MTLRFAVAFLFVCVSIFAAQKEQPPLQYGKVLAQDLTSDQAGTYAAPMGTARIAVPIYRRSNQVTIETDRYIDQWVEIGRKTLILPVNGEVTFWQEKNVFVVLDANAHKHKFAVVGMTSKSIPPR
jgi:hypothetical protein